MANENAREDSVLVRLSVMQPGNINFPERRILLTESNPIAQIGRSSSRPSLKLQPAVVNGWYNSPVMSRHHAELEADFTSETVSIRDLGSMHGTFLNKSKVVSHVSQPTRIRVGDELTLGLPVFRNREEFQPVLVRVDAMDFHEASRRPTTTPTRTFTVPDDCSTDDNEPLDETFDEPRDVAPGTNPTVGKVDDAAADLVYAPNPWIDTHPSMAENLPPTSQSNAGSFHQLDGFDDASMPGDALHPPARMNLGAWSDLSSDNGSLICNDSDSAGPTVLMDDLTDSDDEDQDMDSLHIIERSNDLNTQNANHGDESRSPSWNSFSSDSEDEHMDNESVLDGSASEGFALFEDDSDEIVDEAGVDGKMQPDADHDIEQQTLHSLRAPSMDMDANRAPVLPNPVPRLPPISSVISAGPNDWMSCSHSNWGPRSPSPSDAVLLPRHCRPEAAGSEKIQDGIRLDTADHIVSEDKEDGVDYDQVEHESSVLSPEALDPARVVSHMSALAFKLSGVVDDTAGDEGDLTTREQRSEKAEFFAARAANKRVHDANMRVHVSSHNECEADMNVPLRRTSKVADSSSGFILAPNAHGLTRERAAGDMAYMPEPAEPQQPLLKELKSPFSLKATEWVLFDPDSQEPFSAYEMQCLKQQDRDETPSRGLLWAPRNDTAPLCGSIKHTVQAPINVDVGASEDLPAATSLSFEQLEHQRQELEVQEASVLPVDKRDVKKGKRKAGEISQESPQESQRSFAEEKSKATSLSNTVQSPSYSPCRSGSDQGFLPSPPPSPEEIASPEQRPYKKIKRIAERVGYAALGGVSVGAMVLTSLIYTAPNFG